MGTGPKYHINLIVEHRYPRRVKTGSRSPVLSLPERQDGDHGMTTQQEAVQLDSVEMGSVGDRSVRQPSQCPAPNYTTWKKHHHKMNGFHHHWQDEEYAIPPFAVICRVLCQVRRDKCWIVRDSANSTMLGDPDVVFDSQEDAMGQAHATLVQPKVTPGPSG